MTAVVDWSQRQDLNNWFAVGERGLSSEAIVARLTARLPRGRWGYDHPHDPSDFRRCDLLLSQVPLLELFLPQMADASPQWAALIARWEDIRAAAVDELPDWPRSRQGSAPKTYALMREVLASAKCPMP